MIRWVASYPRSGNTLLRVVLRYGFGLRCPPRYRRPTHLAPPTRTTAALRLGGKGPLPSLEDMANGQDPWFVKTHELPCDDRPALYVVRDGRDALVSYAHFIEETADPREPTRAFEEILTALVLKDEHFGGWGPHVAAWSARRAPTAILRFEELVADDPAPAVGEALESIGAVPLRPGDGEIPDFASLQRAQPRNFREGKVGAWRREMPESLARTFAGRHGVVLEKMGYEV